MTSVASVPRTLPNVTTPQSKTNSIDNNELDAVVMGDDVDDTNPIITDPRLEAEPIVQARPVIKTSYSLMSSSKGKKQVNHQQADPKLVKTVQNVYMVVNSDYEDDGQYKDFEEEASIEFNHVAPANEQATPSSTPCIDQSAVAATGRRLRPNRRLSTLNHSTVPVEQPIKAFTNEPVVQCNECSRRFFGRRALSIHRTRVHQLVVNDDKSVLNSSKTKESRDKRDATRYNSSEYCTTTPLTNDNDAAAVDTVNKITRPSSRKPPFQAASIFAAIGGNKKTTRKKITLPKLKKKLTSKKAMRKLTGSIVVATKSGHKVYKCQRCQRLFPKALSYISHCRVHKMPRSDSEKVQARPQQTSSGRQPTKHTPSSSSNANHNLAGLRIKIKSSKVIKPSINSNKRPSTTNRAPTPSSSSSIDFSLNRFCSEPRIQAHVRAMLNRNDLLAFTLAELFAALVRQYDQQPSVGAGCNFTNPINYAHVLGLTALLSTSMQTSPSPPTCDQSTNTLAHSCYKCVFCRPDKAFDNGDELRRHIESEHYTMRPSIVNAAICTSQRGTIDRSNTNALLDDETRVACNLCHSSFASRASLRTHLHRYHFNKKR